MTVFHIFIQQINLLNFLGIVQNLPFFLSKNCCVFHKVTCFRLYEAYSESKYRLRISLAHPRDCHFAHVQRLPLSIQKPQTPFREIRVMFMFVPVR